MGTPALLNDSIPAVVLRLLEPPARGRPLPDNWVVGNDPGRLQLPASHAVAGVASGAVALVVGIVLIGRRVRRHAPGRDDEPVVSAALVALALASAPIAWYHYQLLNLPGIAMLVVRWMRRRRFAALALLACMVVAGTWASSWLLGPYVARYGWTAANPALLWFATSVTLVADLALFAALLWELGACPSTTPAANPDGVRLAVSAVAKSPRRSSGYACGLFARFPCHPAPSEFSLSSFTRTGP
jgi:hypothetical protein